MLRLVFASAIAAAVLMSASAAQARHFKIIYSFCAESGCPDGGAIQAGLLMDASGNFYGTTVTGGGADKGVAYELVANPRKTAWKYKLLHSFCSSPNCADGDQPRGRLIQDVQGNLYGATYWGGKHNGGTVYRLSSGGGRKWKLTTLYNFCSKLPPLCEDSYNPNTTLTYAGVSTGALYDGHSPLFGTTLDAVPYVVQPGKKHWSQQVIGRFCQSGCDGWNIMGGVVADPQGNAYGTTQYGDDLNGGIIFEETPDGSGGYAQTTLHKFALSDGAGSQLSPIYSDGALYGVTQLGGDSGYGVVYKLAIDGTNSVETVLHSFCVFGPCTDGGYPSGPPALDANGNLFGTAGGGDQTYTQGGGGILYEITSGAYHVIHNFCSTVNCTDGAWPVDGVILNDAGDLFGIAGGGGKYGHGIVYTVTDN